MFAYVGSIQNLKDLKVAPFGVSVVGDLMLQPWDTMSLRTADLSSVCVASEILLD